MNTDPGTGDFGAFDGVRVVELAQWVFVPVAGALLADWGADVIRIERLDGDPYRGLATQGIGTDSGGVNLSMALANRGKRSIAIDLRDRDGLAVLHELLASADVLLTSLRPGALERLGLDADAVRERYPSLIYARGNGFGVRGPDADQPGYDSSAFWARGGVAHMLTPARPRLSDQSARRDGRPQRGDGAGVRHRRRSAQTHAHRRGFGGRRLAARHGDVDAVVGPARGAQRRCDPASFGSNRREPADGTYRTKDGRHIQLVFLQGDRYWADFCRTSDGPTSPTTPASSTSPHGATNAAACVAELDAVFAERTFDEWKELLAHARRAVGADAVGRGAASTIRR